MRKPQHTPGPYIIDRSHSNEIDGLQIWDSEHGYLIAIVPPDQHNQHEANARLIAQAWLLPELVERLKQSNDLLETIYFGDENPPETLAKNREIIEKVRFG